MLDERLAAPGFSSDSDGRILLSEVSNRMVQIYKDQFGRGPTKARSEWAGPDTLICTLEDSFSPAERTLVQMGEHQRLRELRVLMLHAGADRMRGTVEQITGRKVRAFVSGTDTDKDVSVEVFYLAPLPHS